MMPFRSLNSQKSKADDCGRFAEAATASGYVPSGVPLLAENGPSSMAAFTKHLRRSGPPRSMFLDGLAEDPSGNQNETESALGRSQNRPFLSTSIQAMRDLRFLLKTHYSASRALIVGIDQYQGASPLSYAVSDAIAVKALLIEQLKFPESDVLMLTNEEATKQAILRSFLRFSNDDVGLDERIVVFFAGHGHTRSGSRGEIGYLVPYDASMSDYSTFIRWDELTRSADLIRAKHVLFIMDACYGGLALMRTATPGSTRFLKDMMLRASRQVLTAAKADEVVADSGGPLPNHSVFTGHLLEAMSGKASTSGGVLTASAVMSYVYSKVANDKNSNQTPHYGHVDGDGDMILHAPEFGDIEASETKDLDRLVSIPYVDVEQELGSIPAKVRRVKTLLASDIGTIELHDMLASEVRRFLSLTSDDSFAPAGTFTVAEFVSRLERYEAASTDLTLLLACVAHWGRSAHLATLQKCIARSSDRLESVSGLVVWVALRWYPLLLELYSAGIAAVDAGRYDSLVSIFETPLPTSDSRRTGDTFLDAAANAILELNRTNVLQQIPGHERNYTPLSDYLLKILQPRLDDTLFLGKNYEAAFDQFEALFALAVADSHVARGEHLWAPIGRFGWKRGQDRSPLARLMAAAESRKGDWAPLKVGLFGGSYERFKTVADELLQIADRRNWF